MSLSEQLASNPYALVAVAIAVVSLLLILQLYTYSALKEAEAKLEVKQATQLAASGRLKDGIPELQPNLTFSSPSVPSESQHASCHRIELDLPFLPSVSEEVLNAANTIWEKVHTRSNGVKFRRYASEDDIAYLVRRYLESILSALNLPLDFSAEVSTKQIRPDICVLLMGMYLVGVVEVKKPGRNILLEPTVLGELLDQMLLVEGFYGMGPIVGILTTGEEWLVSWFPADTDSLAHIAHPKSSHTTMQRKSSSISIETKGYRPPGGTPSQQRGAIHSIDEVMDVAAEVVDGITDEMDRLLCVTPVMNIYKDPVCVLQHLCCAFQMMAKAHLHHAANLSSCLMKFETSKRWLLWRI